MMGFCLLTLSALAAPQEKTKPDEFEKNIRPVLAKYCASCHNPEKKKGEFDLSSFKTTKDVAARTEFWHLLVERVNAFEMPPEKSPQPSFEEKTALNKWFGTLPKNRLDCTQLASDRTQRFYRGYVMSRRLNRSEYANSLRDLLGVELDPARLLPADGSGGEGFDTNGDTLFTSPIVLEKYLEAADLALATVGADTLRERLRVAKPGKDIPERETARKIAAAFARRAFRRPAEDAEVERHLSMFDRARKRGDSFEASLRLALKGVLISPHFLFLVEPEPEKEGVVRLAALPLASRLSYFLWSAPPDEELLRTAETGTLLDPEVLRTQVRRMLKDRRSRALGENFACQWLEVEELGGAVKPDPAKFPEFDDALARSMKDELVSFFHEIVRDDRSLVELIDCDHTYVNERLARLYGIAGVSGPELRRVTLKDRNRGGVLGMAAIHTVTSFPLRTSPVLRGRWIQESLLGSKVPPPPPNVQNLVEDSPDAKTMTLRQRLEKHRTNPECAACHARMDPLGFGLENFDVLGRWRTEERGLAIDAAGQLPSGERFAGAAELKGILLARKDEVMKHLTRKLLSYAMGRALNKFDECVTEDSLKALRARGYKASALIETVVLSYPFQHRYVKK